MSVASEQRCPICKDKECQRHLLARFDASGEEGALGVGLAGGPLYDANEIEEVLERARLAWVHSVRATGKPTAPRWIVKERCLRDYFDALGRSSSGGSGGFHLEKYESDEDAVNDLAVETAFETWYARGFLDDVLFSCGWQGEKTEVQFDMPMLSTTYLSWWAFKPREIVKRFRAKLRRILLEAGVKVKSLSRAEREKEELERLAKGVARLMEEKARDTTGADASKPPTRTAESAGVKRSRLKRASRRKSAPSATRKRASK